MVSYENMEKVLNAYTDTEKQYDHYERYRSASLKMNSEMNGLTTAL